MNWNQLQYVITIAEEKSITKAAQKLYISQPSLSLSIQALEKETGIPLFERKPWRDEAYLCRLPVLRMGGFYPAFAYPAGVEAW